MFREDKCIFLFWDLEEGESGATEKNPGTVRTLRFNRSAAAESSPHPARRKVLRKGSQRMVLLPLRNVAQNLARLCG